MTTTIIKINTGDSTRRGYMDNWTFGLTMIIVGMGGTLATLSLFALLMEFLKLVFPFKEENADD